VRSSWLLAYCSYSSELGINPNDFNIRASPHITISQVDNSPGTRAMVDPVSTRRHREWCNGTNGHR